MRTTRSLGTALVFLATLGACRQLIGYEDPILIDGGGGGTTGTGGSHPTCHAGSPCYTGPKGTESVGACKAGKTTCTADGHVAACQGEVTPTLEDCASGQDQDCNGTVSQCTGTLRWANRFGHASPVAVAVDAMGSTVIMGTASPMANLGGSPLADGGPFLAKYDAMGTHVFSEDFPESDQIHSAVTALATDPSGNIFLTGLLLGDINFGGGPIKNADVLNEAPFLVKLDPDGAQTFSKVLEQGAEAGGYAVAADAAGNVVVGGYLNGKADFGGGPIGVGSGINAFVARFDPAGKHLSSAAFGGSGDARAQSLGVDAMGNIVVVGAFKGTIDFGATPLTSAGSDMFVVRLDPTMKVLYAKKLGSGVVIGNPGFMGGPSSLAVAVDPAGGAVIAGGFTGVLSLDGTMLVTGDDAGSQADVFVAKLDTAGKPAWAQRYGGTGTRHANGVAVDAVGNVVVAGSFSGSLDCGTGCNAVAGGGSGAFALKLSGGDGSRLWVQFVGTQSTIGSCLVGMSAAGDVSLAGSVTGPLSIGTTTLPPPSGGSDLYVAAFTR